MTNTTARNASKLVAQLTPMGRQLMLNIGQQRFSFFDDGIVAESGIWHENLTDESAGIDKLPKTATGVANVIDKLVRDGLLTSSDLAEEGVWVELTKSGAAVANELAASAKNQRRVSPAEQPTKRVVTSAVEPAADVVPLPKTERGRNGTTKLGKSPIKKTGNPKTDAQLAEAKSAPKLGVRATRLAEKRAANAELSAKGEEYEAAQLAKKTAAPAASAAKTASKKTAAPVKKSWATKGLMIVAARKSRVSGTLVWLVNAAAKDSTITPDAKTGMTWARRCVDHDFNDFQASRSAAWLGASDPTVWCPKCRSAAKKTTAAKSRREQNSPTLPAATSELVPEKKTPAKRVAKKSPAKRSTVHIPID